MRAGHRHRRCFGAARDPEVEDPHTIGKNADVARAEVTMEDSVGVIELRNRCLQVRGPLHQKVALQRSVVAYELPKGRRLDELHDDPRHGVFESFGYRPRRDRGVVEPLERLVLVGEPERLGHLSFEDDRRVVRVVGKPDVAEPAGRQSLDHGVAAERVTRVERPQLSHGGEHLVVERRLGLLGHCAISLLGPAADTYL